jgi:hypothetical protein
VANAPEAGLLRAMIGFAAERLMQREVGAMAGAAFGPRDPARLAQRNGNRDWNWERRAATFQAFSSGGGRPRRP